MGKPGYCIHGFETERLILRAWRSEDREPFACINADPMVMQHFRAPLTRDQSDALVDRIEAHFATYGFGLFALERKRDGQFLGFTGLAAALGTPVEGDIEIGWRIAQMYWRKGYAHEAAKACVNWFWRNTDFPRLVSYTAVTNLPSQALMRKLGFPHLRELDFDHPSIPTSHPLCHQHVYVLNRND